jgi:hypothetical protein
MVACLAAAFTLIFTLTAAAEGIEALSVRVDGSAFVKKPGKKFFEALRAGARYPAGTQVKTDAGAGAEFLLSDNATVVMPASTAWTVGETPAGMAKRNEPAAGQGGLWELMVAKLEHSNTTAAKSTVVGAMRAAPDDSPLVDTGTEADRAVYQQRGLSIQAGAESATGYLRGVFYESVGMLASAERAYRASIAASVGDEGRKLAGTALVDLLDRNGKASAAEAARKELGL